MLHDEGQPLRASKKLVLLRYWNHAAIVWSRRRIRRLAETESEIHLTPVRPRGCGGHIDEYFHFIFDLLYPLHVMLETTPSTVTFVVDPFGLNTERLCQIFPERVRVAAPGDRSVPSASAELIGMNPKGVLRRAGIYEGFREAVLGNLGIDVPENARSTLLIERVAPDADHAEHATVKWSGSLRRAVVNHAELEEAVGSLVGDNEFHNLRLETIPFEEQLQHFANARVVIGQHGAGLANCVWMTPGSIVIELNHVDNVTHFNMVCRTKEHEYRMYRTAGTHTEIDVDDFVAWVAADPLLAEQFVRR